MFSTSHLIAHSISLQTCESVFSTISGLRLHHGDFKDFLLHNCDFRYFVYSLRVHSNEVSITVLDSFIQAIKNWSLLNFDQKKNFYGFFAFFRMLYIDCLAHLLSELALLGAYLNILVSSAQSYSMDTVSMEDLRLDI